MIRALIAAALACVPLAAAGQDFPTRPITMIVVFAPGGPTDVMARIAADHMGRTLGQRVVIENVAGAGGTTGGARGARAEPDGYTLTVGSLGSHGAAAALYKTIAYDARELEPVGLIAGTPGYVAVRKDFPAKSLAEFIAYAKANPGKVTSGHAGIGSTPHLACLYFTHLTGLNLVSTPYRGSGPAMNDLVAGQIDQVCDLAPTVVPQIQAGTIRGLVIAQPERASVTPDVATAAESGLPDYVFTGWNAIFAPKGTPKPVIDKLSGALKAALADETVRKRISDLGSIPPGPAEQSPDALRKLVASDVEKWGQVVREAGIAPQ
ncbi:tripartite tricarboxylate transporter substrate-binding protein [uncultured Enterovirga sp.]|uniref:tripartite tricarboxylate transporter substrate-binding protein n=1 Tax=uncultured Enterovirga sp. TaxID=2026352 RepID=UPI0035CBBFC2